MGDLDKVVESQGTLSHISTKASFDFVLLLPDFRTVVVRAQEVLTQTPRRTQAVQSQTPGHTRHDSTFDA